MGKFSISQRSNGQYYFSLKAENGEIILTSEGYTSKMGCMNGVDSVKKNAQEDSKFDRRTTSNGKFFFNLKAANGEIIGRSELYQAESSRENGIEAVKRNAPLATVNDL